MSVSVIVFALLAVLTMEASSHTFRGASSGKVDVRQFSSEVAGKCVPRRCYIEGDSLCKCHPSGDENQSSCAIFLPFHRKNFPGYCICEPGQIFELSTVICTCPTNGRLTVQDCKVKNLEGKGSKLLEQQAAQCMPDYCFVKNDRMCKCHPSGNEDRSLCVAYPPYRPKDFPDFCVCRPGEVFKLSNAICKCPPNGHLLMLNCRRKYVEDKDSKLLEQQAAQCTPDYCFVKDDKMCKCHPSGNEHQSACVNYPPYRPKDFSASCTCQPGEVFEISNAICTCPPSGQLTMRDCRRKHLEDKGSKPFEQQSAQCTPDYCFVKDDRMCKCHPSGDEDQSACANVVPYRPKDFPSSCTCQPGQVFDLSYAICTCPASGKLTMADCRGKYVEDKGAKPIEQQAEECTPDYCFLKDGKMCKCDPSGDKDQSRCVDVFPDIFVARLSVSCKCDPDQVFVTHNAVCTCGKDGIVTKENCRKKETYGDGEEMPSEYFQDGGCDESNVDNTLGQTGTEVDSSGGGSVCGFLVCQIKWGSLPYCKWQNCKNSDSEPDI